MKKLNNTTLAIIFLALVGLFLLVRFVRTPATERNFDTDIIKIDTAKVTELVIEQATSPDPIRLQKAGGQWTVEQGPMKAKTQAGSVENMLSSLLAIRPNRLASSKKDKWEQYKVSDSTGTRVVVKEGGKATLDIYIGKTNYKQGPGGPNPQMGGRPNIIGESFVRLSDKKQVFAVEGFLEMTFSQSADSYRDKSFVQSRVDDITRVAFRYPADSSYTLQKIDTLWQIGETMIEESTVDEYLNRLSYKNGSTFDDTFKSTVNPDFQLIIEGNNMLQIVVKAWDMGGSYVMNSSLNPDSYFSSPPTGMFGDLFVGRSFFEN